MGNKKNAQEAVISAIVVLVCILACLGIISTVMWYVKAQEVKRLKAQSSVLLSEVKTLRGDIETIQAEVDKSRLRIVQANRQLAMAYPKADRLFVSED